MKKALFAGLLGIFLAGIAQPVLALRTPEQEEQYQQQQEIRAERTATATARRSTGTSAVSSSHPAVATGSNGASEAEIQQLKAQLSALTTRVMNLEKELRRVEGSMTKRSK